MLCRYVTIRAELIVDKILGVIISPCGTPRAAKMKHRPPCLQGRAAGQGVAQHPQGTGCKLAVQTLPGSAAPKGGKAGDISGDWE